MRFWRRDNCTLWHGGDNPRAHIFFWYPFSSNLCFTLTTLVDLRMTSFASYCGTRILTSQAELKNFFHSRCFMQKINPLILRIKESHQFNWISSDDIFSCFCLRFTWNHWERLSGDVWWISPVCWWLLNCTSKPLAIQINLPLKTNRASVVPENRGTNRHGYTLVCPCNTSVLQAALASSRYLGPIHDPSYKQTNKQTKGQRCSCIVIEAIFTFKTKNKKPIHFLYLEILDTMSFLKLVSKEMKTWSFYLLALWCSSDQYSSNI